VIVAGRKLSEWRVLLKTKQKKNEQKQQLELQQAQLQQQKLQLQQQQEQQQQEQQQLYARIQIRKFKQLQSLQQ
jgi:hypothetical protein